MPGNSRVELEKAENFKRERPNRTAYHLGALHQKSRLLLQVMSRKIFAKKWGFYENRSFQEAESNNHLF